jgi:hypothetical protein
MPLPMCRWDWCNATFETQVKLAKHVLDNHIAPLQPIKRKDLKLELRARDGTSMAGALRHA